MKKPLNHTLPVLHFGRTALLLLGAILVGCEPATMSMAGAAGQTAVAVVNRGKLDSTLALPFDTVKQGVLSTAEKLAVNVQETQTTSPGRWYIKFTDDRGEWVMVKLDRRTAMVTHVHVDAGLVGNQTAVRMLLNEIILQTQREHTLNTMLPESIRKGPATAPAEPASTSPSRN